MYRSSGVTARESCRQSGGGESVRRGRVERGEAAKVGEVTREGRARAMRVNEGGVRETRQKPTSRDRALARAG